jgi:DNA-binding LytR/AlgR family response regulator
MSTAGLSHRATAPLTALIADDEPLLRERLAAQLARLWPELEVVAQARNGREAVELAEQHAPRIAFLDVHMPGLDGVAAARAIAGAMPATLIVFVTAFEQYAVQAFEQGALDYVVKPFEEARLATTVARLRERLHERLHERLQERLQERRQPADAGDSRGATGPQAADLAQLLDRLASQLAQTPQAAAGSAPAPEYLQWIRASVGASVRLIAVDEVIYLRSDEKYTLVVWPGGEALIRKTIRELADELDPRRFVQTHRSVIVALAHVSHVVRGANETADVHLKGRPEVLPVSRSWLHLFRQM